MSRSSARRAQVEPLPALVAVAVVCLVVGTYATVRADVGLGTGGNAPAEATLAEAVDTAPPADTVVVDPTSIDAGAVGPPNSDVAVTVTAAGREWSVGPSSPPPKAASASQQVPVRIEPGVVRPGRLTVEVWA